MACIYAAIFIVGVCANLVVIIVIGMDPQENLLTIFCLDIVENLLTIFCLNIVKIVRKISGETSFLLIINGWQWTCSYKIYYEKRHISSTCIAEDSSECLII